VPKHLYADEDRGPSEMLSGHQQDKLTMGLSEPDRKPAWVGKHLPWRAGGRNRR
jgi:hypothetical protein